VEKTVKKFTSFEDAREDAAMSPGERLKIVIYLRDFGDRNDLREFVKPERTS